MKVRDLAFCAMFTALMAICGWICIPLPDIALTFQTFCLFLTLLLLGGKRGLLVVCAYLLLGAVGVPVFSGFRGGIGVLAGPTGGYLLGFALGAGLYWAVTASLGKTAGVQISALLVCLLCSYAAGTLWFSRFYLADGGSGSFAVIAAKCVLPYLLPDMLKLFLALVLAKKLKSFVA